jgi:hypothetical protein
VSGSPGVTGPRSPVAVENGALGDREVCVATQRPSWCHRNGLPIRRNFRSGGSSIARSAATRLIRRIRSQHGPIHSYDAVTLRDASPNADANLARPFSCI